MGAPYLYDISHLRVNRYAGLDISAIGQQAQRIAVGKVGMRATGKVH